MKAEFGVAMMGDRQVTDTMWIILRTSAGRTLTLARSLAQAGIEVWTPQEVRHMRLPRSSKRVDRDLAMLPGFVFARAVHLEALRHFTVMPMSPHPAFSIFRWNDGYPLIADTALDPLRRIEQSRRSKRALQERRKAIPTGTRVRAASGPAEGLVGVVEKANAQFATVRFAGGSIPMAIAAYLLVEDGK